MNRCNIKTSFYLWGDNCKTYVHICTIRVMQRFPHFGVSKPEPLYGHSVYLLTELPTLSVMCCIIYYANISRDISYMRVYGIPIPSLINNCIQNHITDATWRRKMSTLLSALQNILLVGRKGSTPKDYDLIGSTIWWTFMFSLVNIESLQNAMLAKWQPDKNPEKGKHQQKLFKVA